MSQSINHRYRPTVAPLLLVVWLVAGVSTIPTLAQDEPVSLRPQWTAGQTARYEFRTQSTKEETAELAGQSETGTTVYLNEGQATWRVEEVAEDGSSVCTMSLDAMKVTITPPQGEAVTVDSANPTGEIPVFDTLLAAMVQTKLTVYVNPDGSIERVEGVDAMKQAAGPDVADSVPDEIDFQETASELATLIAAPAEAGPGDTWRAQNTWALEDILPGMLNIETMADFDTTFTLEQLGRVQDVPVAAVRFRSVMDVKADLSKLPDGVADVDLRVGEASARGELLFDLSRHETIARNDVQSYTVNLTVPLRPGMNLNATIKQTTTSQVLRIEENE
ncbi:MAG: DUF6263 family protein [Planctomycetota bacterium]